MEETTAAVGVHMETTTAPPAADYSNTPEASATAAAEAEILSVLVPYLVSGPGAVNGRKRQRTVESRGLCRQWTLSGECSYGDACKYSHSEESRASAAGKGDSCATSAAPSAALSRDTGEETTALVEGPRRTLVERYYTQLFAVDAGGERGQDMYIHLHSNRVIVLGVAPSHPLLRSDSPIVRIAWGSGTISKGMHVRESLDNLKVTGKGKNGSILMEPRSVVATVTTANGAVWSLVAGVRAGIMEINGQLASNPDLLRSKSHTEGFLAILAVKPQRIDELKRALLPREAYERLCALRGLPAWSNEEQDAQAAASGALTAGTGNSSSIAGSS